MPAVSADDEIAEPVVAKVDGQGPLAPPARARGAQGPVQARARQEAEEGQAGDDDDDGHARDEEPGAGSDVGRGGGSTAPSVPTPTEPSPPKPPAGSITVRFGEAASEELPSGWLAKLEPLPDDEEPLLVFMGLTKNGKQAKFLVDASLTPTGDGTCKPHPASCETVLLSRGETEFFDVDRSRDGRDHRAVPARSRSAIN